MGKIRNYLFIVILLVGFWGCNTSPVKQYLLKVNSHLNALKTNFGIDYLKSDLMSHFPEVVEDTTHLRLFSSPPSCPPSYECQAQFGEVYLITTKDSQVENWVEENYLYKTKYESDSNIIINLLELKYERFPNEKCNKVFDRMYPIPFFESYDFNLGNTIYKNDIDGESYVDYIYAIPNDLTVYVITAKAGNFWEEDCNEIRPDSLKEWKNGYSQGIAISEEIGLMVYWTMIW